MTHGFRFLIDLVNVLNTMQGETRIHLEQNAFPLEHLFDLSLFKRDTFNKLFMWFAIYLGHEDGTDVPWMTIGDEGRGEVTWVIYFDESSSKKTLVVNPVWSFGQIQDVKNTIKYWNKYH